MAKAPKTVQESRGQSFPGLPNWKYVAINIFLAFHIFAISCWCLPMTNPFVQVCRYAVRPYFLWTGLFQSWDMFSPQPETTNGYLEAIVLYKDGSTQIWSFPRMDLLSLTNRYSKERYRKFVEVILDDKNSAVWPDVARYVARLPGIRAGNPQKVLLLAKWSTIVYHDDGTFTRSLLDENVFYRYDVRPEDLQ